MTRLWHMFERLRSDVFVPKVYVLTSMARLTRKQCCEFPRKVMLFILFSHLIMINKGPPRSLSKLLLSNAIEKQDTVTLQQGYDSLSFSFIQAIVDQVQKLTCNCIFCKNVGKYLETSFLNFEQILTSKNF